MRIALIQTSVSTDLEANLKKTIRRIRDAARKGARVICLQELFRTRYFPHDEKVEASHFAETVPGESTNAFMALAKELEIVIIVPIFEAAANGRYFNTAAVIDADGTLLGIYRKLHIPHDPFFYEKSYFDEGDLGYKVFQTRYARVAVLICYDQWFPEAARAASLTGAEILFYPTAIGYLKNDPLPYTDWLNAWITIQRGHSIANAVHVAAVNRVGTEGQVTFWGNSFVCNAFGKFLKKAGTREETLIADLDISQNARIREGWRFVRNRRPDTYGSLIEPVRPDVPSRDGYRMPAEWEQHDAMWLAWPEDRVTFPKGIDRVRKRLIEIITQLVPGEEVHLAVRNAETRSRVKEMLKKAQADLSRVHFHVWDYADVWFRDYGPTFVVNRELRKIAIVQWRFNAWGGKYPSLLKDGNVPYFMSERLGIGLFMPGIVLEGGAIDVNGRGTVLTTEQCVLNPNRNPGLHKHDMERYLEDFLGVRHVIWLKCGLVGDHTDGHIDNLARFVGPDTVVCAFEEDPDGENYAVLKQNYELLTRATDQNGQPLRIVKLPVPPTIRAAVDGRKQSLASSYTNFLIGNRVVLVPAFGHPNDERSRAILQEHFPDRAVVGIDCTDLVYGGGTLHCISQQQPST
ncbi:MAG TPA: agmatine deiminase family protein [Terriglobia bacterium]|nr:agmatine deiminase family protein [Terriglobia bacterium]